ncbi:MAG: diguanylate cyclase [Calditrichaceae bacterium]
MTSVKTLPQCIILFKTESKYYEELKNKLLEWGIEVLEADIYARIRNNPRVTEASVAVAIIGDEDKKGIDFLKSIMRANHLVQRFMMSCSDDADIYHQAINKAHIDYFLKLPYHEYEIATYLRKAYRRYQELSITNDKIDALKKFTENLIDDNNKYRMEAGTDSLTDLMNRRSCDMIIKKLWQRYTERGIGFSMALLDIDHFKMVNDTYGHQSGDDVLIKFAEILRKNQRHGTDYAFRYGGEEFMLISSNADISEMSNYVDRILDEVRSTIIPSNGFEISVTFSAGVVETGDYECLDEMVDQVDEALYKAKNSGRNRIVVINH